MLSLHSAGVSCRSECVEHSYDVLQGHMIGMLVQIRKRGAARTLAFLRSLPNMSFRRGTGAFCPSTLSHSRRQSPAVAQTHGSI